MSQPSIAIIGAGIAGSTLARCLTKHGILVVVYEKAKAAPRYNYAITLESQSYKPLARVLGFDDNQFRQKTAVETPIGGLGRLISNNSSRPSSPTLDIDGFRAHRNRLETFLRETLTIKYEHQVSRIELGSRPILHFENGTSFTHDHIIAADGVHSTIRQTLLENDNNKNNQTSNPQHLSILPYIAINGKRRIPHETFVQTFSPSFSSSHTLQSHHPDSTLLHLDVFDQTAESVSVNYIYSRHAHNSLNDKLYQPSRSQGSATEIPEEFYAEIDALGPLTAPWNEIFSVEELRRERKLSWLMRTSRVPLEDLTNLAKRGVVFLGDAVHAQPILGGRGANAAMSDGVELAQEIVSRKGLGGVEEWVAERYEGWMKGVEESERMIERMHSP